MVYWLAWLPWVLWIMCSIPDWVKSKTKLEAQWAEPVSLTFHSALRKLNTEPCIGASYQVSVHLAKQFQRRRFLEINQPETRIAHGSHVCKRIGTKWAIFIEDLPRMLPTKFWFIWPGGFRGEDFFRNQPIRNKNGLWQPCLLTDRDEMSNLYRGPSIDAS